MNTLSPPRPWVWVTGSAMVLSGAMAHAQSVPARKSVSQRIEALERQVSEQSQQI